MKKCFQIFVFIFITELLSCTHHSIPRHTFFTYNAENSDSSINNSKPFMISFEDDTVLIAMKPDTQLILTNHKWDSLINKIDTSYFISKADTEIIITRSIYGPYVFKKEGKEGLVYYMNKNTKAWTRFHQYSFDENDTTHYFELFMSFPTEPGVSGHANYIGRDTTIKVNRFSLKCYIFQLQSFEYENSSTNTMYYIEKSHLIPLRVYTIYDNNGKKHRQIISVDGIMKYKSNNLYE